MLGNLKTEPIQKSVQKNKIKKKKKNKTQRMQERCLPDTWVLEWKKVMTDKVPGTVFKTKIHIQFNKEE